MVDRDFYEVLGVPKNATRDTIKDAYHRLAMKWHPDRNKAPDAEDRFKEIAKAYAILSDPKKRARYDATGPEGIAHFTTEDLFRDLDLGSIFSNFGFGFGPGGDSVFDRFYGRSARATRGEDLRIRLEVPLERIAGGGKERVHFNRLETCTKCNGHGTRSGDPPATCTTCEGSGHKVLTSKRGEEEGRAFRVQQIATCPDCRGSGANVAQPCRVCGGSGQTFRPETVKVKIPRGIEDGTILRIPGHGQPGPANTPAGDLLVQIMSAPDARFQRRGPDLWRSISVGVTDAVLGTEIKVPTLDGDVEVTIPPGTQPDDILRVNGKGLPRVGHEGLGDLMLRISVHIPDHLSDDERHLYEQLRDAAR